MFSNYKKAHFSLDPSKVFLEGFLSQIIYSELGDVDVFRTKQNYLLYNGQCNEAVMQQMIDAHLSNLICHVNKLTCEYIKQHNLHYCSDLNLWIKQIA
jgi:hypothetical protein